MIKFCIGIQLIIAVGLAVFGVYLVKDIRNKTNNENIYEAVKVIENYKNLTDTFAKNVKQSEQIIPGIVMHTKNMTEILTSLKNFKITIAGIEIKIFKKSETITDSIASLKNTSELLDNYHKKTSPALLRSLEDTSESLSKLKSVLLKREFDYTLHIIFFIAGMIIILLSNATIIIIQNKKIETLEESI